MNLTNSRGKALPRMPSAVLGYGSQGRYDGQQNAYKNQNAGRGVLQEPSGRIALAGYKKDILNGFEGEMPRYNPVSRFGERGTTGLTQGRQMNSVHYR